MGSATLTPEVRAVLRSDPNDCEVRIHGMNRVEMDERIPAPIEREIEGDPADDGRECTRPAALVDLLISSIAERVAVFQAVRPHLPWELRVWIGDYHKGDIERHAFAIVGDPADWGDKASDRLKRAKRLHQSVAKAESAVWEAVIRLAVQAERRTRKAVQ
jgi:hypothetical protein